MDRRVRHARTVGVETAARAALEARAGGEPVVVVARCDAAADGRRLLVHPVATRGTLGHPVLDTAATTLGRELLESGTPQPVRREVPAAGAALYAELHRRPPRLVIVGAGHIALPLARVGVELGFPVVVLDDREEFATAERFPAASEVRRVDFADPFRDTPIREDDSVVLVTRAHRYDFDCLHRLLGGSVRPRYLGMVGSRRRIRAAFRALQDAGMTTDDLSAVRAPIGVSIGAETPEEIAVSIAAELVAVRRGAMARGSLRDVERIVERFLQDLGPDDEEQPGNEDRAEPPGPGDVRTGSGGEGGGR